MAKAKKTAAPNTKVPVASETVEQVQEAMPPGPDPEKSLEEEIKHELDAYFETMLTQDPKPPPTHITTP